MEGHLLMRQTEELCVLGLEKGVQLHASGSCLVKLGRTHVLCAASLEDRVPRWMKGKGSGWLTAEYGMKIGTDGVQLLVEIQRLIGRSLRQAVDLTALGERTLTVDCDVLNADGGTRCAAITGAWVAVALALRARGLDSALVRQVAAVSVGIVETGQGRQGMLLDLEYEEDHLAAVDCNLVAARPTSGGELELVEFQGTGEGRAFSRAEAAGLLDLGLAGCAALMDAQGAALG